MSTIVTEIYDALREAGASEEKARKAAEVVASYETKHNDIRQEFALVRGEFNTVKWMLATNLTLTLLVLGKLFLH
jgi:hypothetical protein